MATLTNQQIEQKKQQLKQLTDEAKQLKDELVEAGAWPLSDDELDQASGGAQTVTLPGTSRKITLDSPEAREMYKRFAQMERDRMRASILF